MSKGWRRLGAGAVVLVAATIGVQVAGTAVASAHTNAVRGTATCQPDGTYTVTWTVSNDFGLTESLTATAYTPQTATLAPASVSIGKHGAASMVESAVPGGTTTASLTVHGAWSDGYTVSDSGAVPLAGSCSPARAPTAPTAPTWTDGSCDSSTGTLIRPSVTIPEDTGVGYRLDGRIEPAGTYPVRPGTHTVAASSHSLILTGRTSWTFYLTAARDYCRTVVTPQAPTVTQAQCVPGSSTPTAPTLVLATTRGVRYATSRSAPYRAGETVTITATARHGYRFSAPGAGGWTYQDARHETYVVDFAAAPDCLATVVPQNPAVQQSACGAYGPPSAPTLTLPSTPGITYTASPAAPYTAGQTVIITATVGGGDQFVGPAPPGWSYVDAAHETYSLTFAAAPACLSPQSPAVTQSVCPASGSTPVPPTLTFAPTPGISYSVAPAAPFQGGQTVTVGAAAVGGNEFYTAAPSGWTYLDATHETVAITFAAAPNCAAPATPTFTADFCYGGAPAGASYTVPGTPGVIYSVDGVVTPAGRYPAADGSTVQVSAAPEPGYTLVGTTSWTYTFGPAPDCEQLVVAAPPSFTNSRCDTTRHVPTEPSYTLPASEGVSYLVGGAPRSAGSYPGTAGSTLTITATARPGYELAGTTSWTHGFPAAPRCTVQVAARPPTFSDAACTGPGTVAQAGYTLPAITGVRYLVDGAITSAGSHAVAAPGAVVVTAQALPGYVITGPGTWTHTFAAEQPSDCVAGLVAAQVTFADATCSPTGTVLDGSYTVPLSTGVRYTVQGSTVAAGSHPAAVGSMVTVVATVEAGFALSGVTQWSHTFVAPQYCGLGVSGVQAPPRTVPAATGSTAFTGPPVGPILLAGLAFVALGVASLVVAAGRRRGRPPT